MTAISLSAAQRYHPPSRIDVTFIIKVPLRKISNVFGIASPSLAHCIGCLLAWQCSVTVLPRYAFICSTGRIRNFSLGRTDNCADALTSFTSFLAVHV